MMLLIAFVFGGNINNVNAQENLGKHKAYVYTELQLAKDFDQVPWQGMNPNLKNVPGLMSKTWLSGTDKSPGGFYVFDSIENAQNFVTNIFPVEAKNFGVAQTTRIFDALQTEEASRDMGSVFYVGPMDQKPGAYVYTEVQIHALPFNEKISWKNRNPDLKTLPGLLSKTWLSGLNTGTIGGFYAFDTMGHAKSFAVDVFPESAKRMNAAFYTRIFDASVTESASRDMGSLFYK